MVPAPVYLVLQTVDIQVHLLARYDEIRIRTTACATYRLN
jgi:hypothetical protein